MKRVIAAILLGITSGAYAGTSLGQLGAAAGTKAIDTVVQAAPAPAAGTKPESGRIKAAIAKCLTINLPDNVVRVISVEVGPYPDGVSFPFSAKTAETGVTGLTQGFIVYGVYNSVTGKIVPMGKVPDNSAKSASGFGASQLVCTCNGPGGSTHPCAPVATTCYNGPNGYPVSCTACPSAIEQHTY